MTALIQFFWRWSGVKAADIQNIENKDRIIGHRGPAGFSDNGGMGDFILIQGPHNCFDDIGTVLFQSIIAADIIIGLGAVIIHGQTAAQVQITHGGPFAYQSGVNPACFQDRGADISYIGQLGPNVIVKKFEAVKHLVLF